MLRKRALALAISLMFPAVAPALGLGALKANSALNQPFEGKIEIIGAQPTDFDTLTITLADQTQFERAGMLRSAVLLMLRFDVVTNDKGNDYIRVYTTEAVREPYLDFLLELNWGQGKLVREYTVLLDPPTYDPNRRSAPAASKSQPRAVIAATPAPVPAPRPVVPATPPAAPTAGSSLGTVKSGDTLWKLAQRSKPADISVQQMMIALLRANPEAFPTGNINVLRQGAALRMPSAAELSALSRAEANAELASQNQLWQEYRQASANRATTQQARTETAAPAPASEAGKSDARLEIVNATAKPGAPAAAGSTPADGALSQEKAATESAETRELKARLDEAEDIIDLLQRQVQLKDDELARLQAAQAGKPLPAASGAEQAAAQPSASGEPAAAPPPATDSTTPATPAPAVPAPESTAPPSAAPAAETAPAPPAAPKPPAPQADVTAPPPEVPAAGPLDELIPPAIRDAVPGGAITVLGVLASLLALAGIALARLLGRRSPKPSPAPAKPVTPEAGAAATATAAVSEEPRQPAKTVAPDLRDLTDTHPREEVFDRFGRTIEASAESLVTDPLEEVNVYLAYERFDQAEELVRKVIAESPRDPRFHLRLLEIFYSAGNLAAYETAARDFLALVGENDPMWQSALAMWNAMSPKRPLFSGASPTAATAAAAAATAGAVVDISAPSDAAAIENTQVGLFTNAANEVSPPLDETSDPAMSGMIDLTAGDEQEEILDLTATVEKLTMAGYLATDADPAATEHEVVDLTGGEMLTGADVPHLLDLNATGDVFDPGLTASDDSSAEGLSNTASGGGLAAAFAPEPETEVDFDIGDLGDLDMDATSAPLDLGPATSDGDALDFDIGGLGEGEPLFDATSEVKDVFPAKAAGTTDLIAEDFGLDLDLLGAEGGAALATAEDGSDGPSITLTDVGQDVDFDLSLDETGDVDVTGGGSTAPGAGPMDEVALENLSAELEASLAALGDATEAPEAEEFALDLSSPNFNQINAEDLEIDFDLEGSDQPLDDLDVTTDVDALTGGNAYAVPGQSAFDEVDSKLDLAKAYIELGEHAAARSILAEAAQEGSIAQQEEAGRLLAQIG